jgi:hypothetical protein
MHPVNARPGLDYRQKWLPAEVSSGQALVSYSGIILWELVSDIRANVTENANTKSESFI